MRTDERRATATGVLLRALRWFRVRGIRAERAMSDNGSAYVSRFFAEALRLLGLRHVRTRPCAPKTNGKAERFIQTPLRGCACAIPYRSSKSRAADLPRWLDWHNQRRPDSALGRRVQWRHRTTL